MDQYGGEKKSKKTKKTTKTTKTTKSTKDSTKSKTKKSTKTTKTRSKAKGGNFLGAVGDLVAPTGWGPFATAAGLLALDRADAALRRGTKEKKEKMKGGKKMKGGLCQERKLGQIQQVTIGPINYTGSASGDIFSYYEQNGKTNEYRAFANKYNWDNKGQNIVIKCNNDGKYYYEVNIKCDNDIKRYEHIPRSNTPNSEKSKYYFDTFEEAELNARKLEIQKSLIKLALLNKCKMNP